MSFTARIRLDGKAAFVTGAAAGIGRATALLFAEQGVGHLVLVDLDAEGLTTTAQAVEDHEARTTMSTLNVADWGAVEQLVESIGEVDILVNAAGNISSSPFDVLELSEWQATIDSHLKGCFVTSRLLAPGMVERGDGRIVNVASVAGKRGGGFLGKTAYAAAKAGVDGLTKVTARELAPHGIRVNSVNPGLTDTRRLMPLREDPSVWERCLAAVPLNREAEPREIANAIVWLASDAATFVTGETMNVDGGIAME